MLLVFIAFALHLSSFLKFLGLNLLAHAWSLICFSGFFDKYANNSRKNAILNSSVGHLV